MKTGPAAAGMLASLCMVVLPWTARGEDRILFAAEHTRMPLCAPVVAMGDAGVALPSGAVGLYHNPAIPSLSTGRQLWAEGAKLYGGMSNQGAIAFGTPIQDGMSASVMYTAFFPGDILLERDTLSGTYLERLNNPSLRAQGGGDGVFRDNHHLLLASLSKKFTIPIPRPAGFSLPLPVDVAMGINAKYAWQTMSIADKLRMGMNVNVDAGLLISVGVDFDIERRQTSRQVLLGAALRNTIPTDMIWVHSPEGYREPVDNAQYYGLGYVDDEGVRFLTWKCAASLHRTLGGVSTVTDTLGARALSTKYENTYHYGVAVGLWRIVEIRGGFSNRVPTLGAGVRYHNFSLDYALRFDEIMYSPVRLSVSAEF